MGTCRYCEKTAPTISDRLGFCGDCVRDRFSRIRREIESVHRQSRAWYDLPEHPPRAENGVPCALCFHRCRIPEGEVGFCGVRTVVNGRVVGGRPREGNVSYYHDPLPTNCVADFVCPAGRGGGYPEYSVSRGPEYGFKNLAVFYQACSFNCLYCQNYQFKERTSLPGIMSAEDLAGAVDDKTTCICHFGGDPSPQILHALKASSIALSQTKGRVLRICWETNGAMELPFLERIADLSLRSGGCIKFDLKAWHEGVHRALCGVANTRTLENFKQVSALTSLRHEPPLLIASTLLVPGYVDEEEVSCIAEYVASLDRDIPYRLLGFYPHFVLRDLPTTSRAHAERCKQASEKAGLRRVDVGNVHLLGMDYA